MKLMYGNVPVKSLNIHHYELNTNDCDMVASDLQAGKTAVARGQKIVGTGKSFEFAFYGVFRTNDTMYIPSNINVVEITSVLYPIQHAIALGDMKNIDFSTSNVIGNIVVDGTFYPIIVQAANNFINISCDVNTDLQIFFGKDNYV